jgi:hypothetical protein
MSRLKKSMDKNAASGNGCFVNAGMVAGVSILTDHKSNLKLHGTLDAVQAMKAALGLSFTICGRTGSRILLRKRLMNWPGNRINELG